MTNYEELLEQAYEKVKQVDNSSERFKIPQVEGHFEGRKTVLTNFFQIASHLRRKPEHFQKFLLKRTRSIRTTRRRQTHLKYKSFKRKNKSENRTICQGIHSMQRMRKTRYRINKRRQTNIY